MRRGGGEEKEVFSFCDSFSKLLGSLFFLGLWVCEPNSRMMCGFW